MVGEEFTQFDIIVLIDELEEVELQTLGEGELDSVDRGMMKSVWILIV